MAEMPPHAPALFKQGVIHLTCEMMREYNIPNLEAAQCLIQLANDLLERDSKSRREKTAKCVQLKECCKDTVVGYVEKNKGSPNRPDVDITCIKGHRVRWTGKTWIDATETDDHEIHGELMEAYTNVMGKIFPQCCREAIKVRDQFEGKPVEGYAFKCDQDHLTVWNGEKWMKSSEYMGAPFT